MNVLDIFLEKSWGRTNTDLQIIRFFIYTSSREHLTLKTPN